MGEGQKSSSPARRIVLAIVLLMTFKTFQYFPGMQYVQEAWFVLCFLIVFFVYPFWKLQMGLRFVWFEVYLLALMLGDVILAAWRAQYVFGQPLLYGILVQRGMVLIAVLLILVNALRRRMVGLAEIESALLYLVWGTFVLFSAMRLLLNPSSFASYGVGFVTEPMPGTEAAFVLPSLFLIYGVFYYAILGMRTGLPRYYLAAAVLLFASLGASGRGLIVCVAASLLFSLYRLRGLRHSLVTIVKFGCIAVVLVGTFYVVFPAIVSARIAGFSDAFTVVFTGSATQDASANARIFETLTALPYIQKHPILGNGVVSHQWQGGTAGALGQYFYADDIGVIGVVFSYGVFGLLLYLFQYQFAWIAAKGLQGSSHCRLLDAVKAYILYTAFYSVAGGMCVWSAEVTLFFIALLMGIAAETS